jgi:hypothetical protein
LAVGGTCWQKPTGSIGIPLHTKTWKLVKYGGNRKELYGILKQQMHGQSWATSSFSIYIISSLFIQGDFASLQGNGKIKF